EGVLLLITINSFDCVIETIYIGLFIFYAPEKSKNAKSVIMVHEDQPKLELPFTSIPPRLLSLSTTNEPMDMATLIIVLGVLGNIVSFMAFLALVKSAEGFQSLPYLIALLSSMLSMYDALLQEGIQTVNILLLLNVFGYGLMIVLTTLLTKGDLRRKVVGLICLAFNIGVFAAPFSTMNAKSVIVVHEDQSKLELEGVLQLITIYSFGCVIETIYIGLFIFYASKKSKIQTVKILLLPNVFGYGLMIVLTTLLTKGDLRRQVVGLICLAFNIGVFAAHFSTMNAKSVIVFHENQPELELV
ncbi:hypothetical protein G4B88_030223, partial [Cannabis sativa]